MQQREQKSGSLFAEQPTHDQVSSCDLRNPGSAACTVLEFFMRSLLRQWTRALPGPTVNRKNTKVLTKSDARELQVLSRKRWRVHSPGRAFIQLQGT